MTPAIAGFARFPPGLVLALVLSASLLLWPRVHWLLFRLAAWCCFDWGAFRATRALVGFLGLLPVTARMRSSLLRMELDAHLALGHTEAAVAGARRLAVHAKADGCAACANCAVNIFINAGLYLEALDIERGWQGPLKPESPAVASSWVMVRFNLVEAVYNLGDWDAASARLSGLEEEVREDPFLWNYFPVQRAWILAHTGRGEDALAALEKVEWRRVPRAYRSELPFSRAAALLALHRYDEAKRAVLEGLELARRVSSTRNGLFLLGRIALGEGRLEEALPFFEAGATYPTYKGQGGDALLAWGDCLEKLGRKEEARAAWRLVLERDKQSGAAWEASSRLGSRQVA